MDKQIYLSNDSPIFPLVQKILKEHFKDYSAEKIEKIVKINNAGKYTGTYKFAVDWQDENQNCFDIFKVVEEVV